MVSGQTGAGESFKVKEDNTAWMEGEDWLPVNWMEDSEHIPEGWIGNIDMRALKRELRLEKARRLSLEWSKKRKDKLGKVWVEKVPMGWKTKRDKATEELEKMKTERLTKKELKKKHWKLEFDTRMEALETGDNSDIIENKIGTSDLLNEDNEGDKPVIVNDDEKSAEGWRLKMEKETEHFDEHELNEMLRKFGTSLQEGIDAQEWRRGKQLQKATAKKKEWQRSYFMMDWEESPEKATTRISSCRSGDQ